MQIVDNEPNYFLSQKSAKETAQIIHNKTSTYLSEQNQMYNIVFGA